MIKKFIENIKNYLKDRKFKSYWKEEIKIHMKRNEKKETKKDLYILL